MSFEIFLYKTVSLLLLPPGGNFVLLLAGFLALTRKKRKLAKGIFASAISILYFFSLPIVSNSMTKSLQTVPALTQNQVKQISVSQRDDMAIVVLSGGRIQRASEYGEIDMVSSLTLQRIQYASWLHKKTKLPILVSGGSVFNEPTSEAVLMNQTMQSSFGIAPLWIEGRSKNTEQNAKYSVDLLKQNNISEILLVTHANHMPRALQAFEQYGLKITPAPTAFKLLQTSWLNYLPSAKALEQSQASLHEQVGRIWYRLRH